MCTFDCSFLDTVVYSVYIKVMLCYVYLDYWFRVGVGGVGEWGEQRDVEGLRGDEDEDGFEEGLGGGGEGGCGG